MTESMRALLLRDLAGPAALELAEVPRPVGLDRVHIEVGAAGVNFPDLLAMRGEYQGRTEPPFVPGAEVAGVVTSAPAGSTWSRGDRVVALTGTGGYAEHVAVPPALVAAAPLELDHAESVALVANHQTAYFALTARAQMRPGEVVVVLGSAGGLGSAAIQVAHGLGAIVIGVVHRSGADHFVEALGADHVVPLRDGWAAVVRELTNGRGADVVIDPVGGPAFEDAVRCLRPGGRVVVLGFAAGSIPTVAVKRLLLRNVGVVGAGWGEFLRTEPEALPFVARGLAGLVSEGMRPPVTERVPLHDGAAALRRFADGKVIGKMVLEP